VAVHTATPPSVTVIVEPSGKSVVPEIVGVVSFVTAGELAVTTGAVTSITVVVVAVVVFPAASVPEAVNVCEPSDNAVVGSQVHDPSAATVAVHTATPPSVTVIVEPSGKSVVPEIVGVVSFVTAGELAVTTGAVVSTVYG
jgi:hypothetical protein